MEQDGVGNHRSDIVEQLRFAAGQQPGSKVPVAERSETPVGRIAQWESVIRDTGGAQGMRRQSLVRHRVLHRERLAGPRDDSTVTIVKHEIVHRAHPRVLAIEQADITQQRRRELVDSRVPVPGT
jgi:hypothetical protein